MMVNWKEKALNYFPDLEYQIKQKGTLLKETLEILEEYRIEENVDFSKIRESFQLATELKIWAYKIITKNVEFALNNHSLITTKKNKIEKSKIDANQALEKICQGRQLR